MASRSLRIQLWNLTHPSYHTPIESVFSQSEFYTDFPANNLSLCTNTWDVQERLSCDKKTRKIKLLWVVKQLLRFQRFWVLTIFTAARMWSNNPLFVLVSQMEDSEGTVRQIGAFSEGIQNLTVRVKKWTNIAHWTAITLLFRWFLVTGVKLQFYFLHCHLYQSMLKDDEFFKEISNSPNLSVTDEDSNAWGCQRHQTWSCCEWNSVPTHIDLSQ